MARKNKSDSEETITKIIIEEPERPVEMPEEPAPRQRKPIEIRAAHLKDSMFCHYTYDHTVAPHTTNEVKCKSVVPVHDHLKLAFARLNPHFAVICEEVLSDDIPDIDDIEGTVDAGDLLHEKLSLFSVVAFKLDGEEHTEGIYLTGFKRLSTGAEIEMKAPKIRWDSSYAFAHEFRMAIMDLIIEVEKYMGGKQAPKAQISMFDEDDEEEDNDGPTLTTAAGRLPKANKDAMARVAGTEPADDNKPKRQGRKSKTT